MIAVDSSALVAILEAEPDAAVYATAIQNAERLFVSTVTVLETGMVIRARRGEAGLARMWRFLMEDNDFQIVPFTKDHAREALAAFERFGKGMHSPRGSTFVTVPLMRWPRAWTCRCCSRARISARPMCGALSEGR